MHHCLQMADVSHGVRKWQEKEAKHFGDWYTRDRKDNHVDDSEEDPDYDILEETHRSFSNLSLRNKAKKRIVEDKCVDTAINSDVLD
ncbi:hypothetical protein TSUD_90880 [Trifolium subterraneum]|uniref:Uncharacterized protein n=1 Tax=Trifolium subterraneum TaxID=3900 RepID=A0A2Z6PIL8_TRISU|nr:hypothetical protein TSUD_90880 [Trifolium subterraneum]